MRHLSIGLFAFTALVLTGCPRNNAASPEDKRQVAQNTNPAPKPTTGDLQAKPADNNGKPEALKPDLAVSGEALVKDLMGDGAAVDKKYRGKAVEITGKVSWVSSRDEFILDELSKDSGALSRYNISCRVPSANAEQAAKVLQLSDGQRVKVVGKCAGVQGNSVVFENCTLAELEPGKLPKVSFEQIAKEFETDTFAARSKYERKSFLVSGTLLKAVKNDNGAYVELKGTDKFKVSFGVRPSKFASDADWGRLKSGQTVEIRLYNIDRNGGNIGGGAAVLVGTK